VVVQSPVVGPEDDDDCDLEEIALVDSRVPPPDDRVWRHPSELGEHP